MVAATSTERGQALRERNRALGRKRPDIPMTDAEKIEVLKLLKKLRKVKP